MMLPRIPYQQIQRAILGARYELSFMAVSAQKARALNKKYRGKSYVPDVLAFPLSKHEGEIVFNAQAITREAKKRGISVRAYTGFIFIHACLHLKGLTHGKGMEKREKQYLKKFKFTDMLSVL